MTYRRLGRSGLKVSLLSLGSWVTFGNQVDEDLALSCMQAAFEGGVNFFDSAEVYAGGRAEEILGRALRRAGWPRSQVVVSTKLYWGIDGGVNTTRTLNRKYLFQALEGSLERLQLPFVDLLFCHRPDPETPVEETVWAMNDLVAGGRALYWGTSEWPADDIRAALEIAERHHLRKPVMEQPQYNLLARERVEVEYRRLLEDFGLGLTIWSPLASGVLSGKYVDGVPEGSRATISGYDWLRPELTDPARNAAARRLGQVAGRLGCTTAQLAIAWCAANPRVSSVITGATRREQVLENLGALDVLARLDGAEMAEIARAVGA